MGGEDALLAWAKDNNRNRAAFYQWITKMLPADVEVKQSGEVKYDGKLVIEIIDPQNPAHK